MSILKGNQMFFVLSQNSLSSYLTKNQPPPLVFPQTVVKNQEIKDKKKLEEMVKEYLAHFSKQQVILFLADEIVYSKQITLAKDKTIDDELKSFLDKVPFIPETVEKKVIQTNSNIDLFATNADLYKTIVAVATQSGILVRQVVPLFLFQKKLEGQQLSFDMLSGLTGDKSLLEHGDLLTIKEDKPKESVPAKQIIMLIVSLCFFAGAVILLLINLGIISYKAEQKATPLPKRVITPTVMVSPTLSASDEAALKKNLPIAVINASGITGEARIVTDLLNQAGYTNTSSTNTSATVSGTTVSFVATVSASMQNEILATLDTLFTSVKTEQSSGAASPVIITIGQKTQ